MFTWFEHMDNQVCERSIAFVSDNIKTRRGFGESGRDMLQHHLWNVHRFFLINLTDQDHHQVARSLGANNHIAKHPFMIAQIDKSIVVLVSKIANCVADTIRYIVLQPALLYSQYFIKCAWYMKADCIHLIVFHVLFYLFICQPTLIRECKFQLITLELCLFRT